MNVRKIDLSFRVFTPIKVCLVLIISLASVVLWQFALIAQKSHTLSTLSSENADLRKNLVEIDTQLADLRNSATDVRLFQREIIKVMKGIDQSYPVSLAPVTQIKAHHTSVDGFVDVENTLNNANETIFKLSSSQETLWFDTASLLGKAISMKDVLDNTPSVMPVVHGQISSGFGMRQDPFTHRGKFHHGLDIRAPIGTPVYAAADGMVEIAGRNSELGNYVRLSHKDGSHTVYGHLSSIAVRKGSLVKGGKEIGRVGNTGLRCQGSHLHFEMSKNGKRINPKPYLIRLPNSI